MNITKSEFPAKYRQHIDNMNLINLACFLGYIVCNL